MTGKFSHTLDHAPSHWQNFCVANADARTVCRS